MPTPRNSCCSETSGARRCGTRWADLRVCARPVYGKGVRVVLVQGDEQGKAPFFAQPVGFDGRAFHIAADYGCDTEKLLHEVCHWLVAPKDRRGQVNYGHGPGPHQIDDCIADNEEVCVMLLEKLLAPHFRLADDRIAKTDYNVANKRHLDWDACEARAQSLYESLVPSVPAVHDHQQRSA